MNVIKYEEVRIRSKNLNFPTDHSPSLFYSPRKPILQIRLSIRR